MVRVEEAAGLSGCVDAPRIRRSVRIVNRPHGLRFEFAADVDVHTLNGAATRVSLTAGYDKSTQHLKIDVQADEPGGGMVASLLGLKGAPPLHLQAKGDGPLRDWQGRLEAAAGDDSSRQERAAGRRGARAAAAQVCAGLSSASAQAAARSPFAFSAAGIVAHPVFTTKSRRS